MKYDVITAESPGSQGNLEVTLNYLKLSVNKALQNGAQLQGPVSITKSVHGRHDQFCDYLVMQAVVYPDKV